ncbi:hypothetical protein K2173_018945 [Erythroxylum novogranatense]|uniref:Protein kinase domain-containing protein n=1 Tax=Erythroxylum novogranatense TaxID=1862640 RepID=A0AAV8SS97_9ROSI|nr:hypothetical protein K2173_018945 [Erythroxylum novogranatense]
MSCGALLFINTFVLINSLFCHFLYCILQLLFRSASMFIIKSLLVFILNFLCSLLLISGTPTDISCLKSVKGSLVDPYGYLKYSWNFENTTEGFICKFIGVECWHADENKVLHLRLADMGLKGRFPERLRNCTSLVGLNLSNNELYGPIPLDISSIIPFATSVDLSSNNFSGVIPPEIANLSYLNVLKLDHNRLTGNIPREVGYMNRLKTFSVANNLLSGQVPNFTDLYFGADSYANNIGLCGGPLEPCKRRRTMKFDYSFKGGFIIGYVFSFVSVIVVSVSYCVPFVRVRNSEKMITVASMVMLMLRTKNKENVVDQVTGLPTMEIPQEELTEISRLEKKITRLGYEELSDATNGFGEETVIGCGETGIMHKATLPNGCFLAVKKMDNSVFLEERFVSELKTLGTFRHANLLPLLGFHKNSTEMLLVYKFMPNGNLYDRLHHRKCEAEIMDWPERAKIAVGLARGLSWLHQKRTMRIIHLGINSKSILLDHDFEPKLSNFGEAMLIRESESEITRSFYVSTDLWQGVFMKDDVHSFGVVLLELITGVDTREMMTNSLESYHCNCFLKELKSRLLSSSCSPESLIDKSLLGKGFDGEIFRFLEIACACVQSDSERRPTMLEAYESLKAIGTCQPEISVEGYSEDERMAIEIAEN